MRIWALPAAFAMASLCLADTVTLSNGDRLTGEVVRLENGTLTFATELVGQVRIAWSEVSELQIDAPLTAMTPEGPIEIAPQYADGKWDVDLQILALNPSPPPSFPWTGSVVGNLAITQAERNAQTASVQAAVERKTPTERIDLGASFLQARQEDGTGTLSTTEESWRLRGQLDRPLQDRLFWYANGRLERDRIASLDLRTVLGGGLGYVWRDEPDFEFVTETGFSHVAERYSRGLGSEDTLNLSLGSRLRWQLTETIELRHLLNALPNPEDFGDLYLASELSLRSRLGGGLFADLTFQLDYDTTPAPGARRDNTRTLLGLGFRF